MATFTFVYGVKCEVQADSESEALSKMISLQSEEECPCKKSDCFCIHEGDIGIWQESLLDIKANF